MNTFLLSLPIVYLCVAVLKSRHRSPRLNADVRRRRQEIEYESRKRL
jgi:hypothetical protein